MELSFVIALTILLYMYAGYPLLLAIIAKFCDSSPAHILDECPPLSIVIAAHNEEANIERRIRNLLGQDYDSAQLQIIVGCDGSTDQTLSILESLRSDIESEGAELKILNFEDRGGKPRILNHAVKKCRHDLIMFADARQTFAHDALRKLVAHFNDPKLGAVSGELFLHEPTDDNSIADMGIYWRYEKLVRKLEAKIHSTVGATGAIYAIRRNLFREIPEQTLIDDVVIPMQICLQGYRVGFASDAHAFDLAPTDTGKEWLRKVRTLAGNWQLFAIRPSFFVPGKNPVFLQFLSHKILRLLMPICLATLFVSSCYLPGQYYGHFFMLQAVCYLIGLGAFFSERLRQMRIPGLIYFFCILNAAIIVGLYRIASGQREGLWSFAYKPR